MLASVIHPLYEVPSPSFTEIFERADTVAREILSTAARLARARVASVERLNQALQEHYQVHQGPIAPPIEEKLELTISDLTQALMIHSPTELAGLFQEGPNQDFYHQIDVFKNRLGGIEDPRIDALEPSWSRYWTFRDYLLDTPKIDWSLLLESLEWVSWSLLENRDSGFRLLADFAQGEFAELYTPSEAGYYLFDAAHKLVARPIPAYSLPKAYLDHQQVFIELSRSIHNYPGVIICGSQDSCRDCIFDAWAWQQEKGRYPLTNHFPPVFRFGGAVHLRQEANYLDEYFSEQTGPWRSVDLRESEGSPLDGQRPQLDRLLSEMSFLSQDIGPQRRRQKLIVVCAPEHLAWVQRHLHTPENYPVIQLRSPLDRERMSISLGETTSLPGPTLLFHLRALHLLGRPLDLMSPDIWPRSHPLYDSSDSNPKVLSQYSGRLVRKTLKYLYSRSNSSPWAELTDTYLGPLSHVDELYELDQKLHGLPLGEPPSKLFLKKSPSASSSSS